jgi:hypothetical protein
LGNLAIAVAKNIGGFATLPGVEQWKVGQLEGWNLNERIGDILRGPCEKKSHAYMHSLWKCHQF